MMCENIYNDNIEHYTVGVIRSGELCHQSSHKTRHINTSNIIPPALNSHTHTRSQMLTIIHTAANHQGVFCDGIFSRVSDLCEL